MKNAFRKHHLKIWHLYYKLIFLNGAYHVFEKNSSYVYIYIYKYTVKPL